MKMPKTTGAAAMALESLAPDGPDVTRRQMFGQSTVFVNGHMFLGTFGGDLFVRLSEADRGVALSEAGMSLLEPMPGRAMREYVVLPDAILADRKAATEWVLKGLAYTRSLPPKSAAPRRDPSKPVGARQRKG